MHQKRRTYVEGGRAHVYLTVYSAALGETNDLHVVRETEAVYVADYFCDFFPEMCVGAYRSQYVPESMVVADPGARPRVLCGACESSALEVWLRDGDDRLRIDGWPHYEDVVYGMGGDDHLDVKDGNGGDYVSCGSGTDTVLMDLGDHATADCELRDDGALP